MSKSDGPAANSFESPRKVGWLYKQGGSGMTSHWRKRWFVVDHHYLFYYKKPDDKSPVGILCLPEYDSCYKSEGKEWKKPNTFLLGKGKEGDATDGHSKSYVLHSDTENEMLEWIEALKEEMKPMLDADRESLPNGRSQPSPVKGKGKPKPVPSSPKVDAKAFNELSELAAETPKLTHLTASRPKVRNRRPPKKYAVFHEDDSREDESPPPSPSLPGPTPSTPGPTPSPTSQPKKGHRPSAPMMPRPSKPLFPPKERKNETSPSPVHEGGEQATPEAKKAPPTPRKPPKERPLPPSKPSKQNIDTPATAEPEATPTVKKPRPPQPPIKPRASTTSTPSLATPTTDKPTPPQPVPKPRPRRRTQVVPDTPTSEETPPLTISEESATPPIKEEVSPAIENDVTTSQESTQEEETVLNETTPTEPETATPPTTVKDLEESQEVAETRETLVEEAKIESKEEPESEKTEESSVDKHDDVVDDSESETFENEPTTESDPPPIENGDSKDENEVLSGNVPEEAESVKGTPEDVGKPVEDEKPTEKAGEDNKPAEEEAREDEKKSDTGSEDLYEDMDMGAEPPDGAADKEDSGSEYEEMDFEPLDSKGPARHSYDMVAKEDFTGNSVDISIGNQTNSHVPQPGETASKGQSTSSHVLMDPTSPIDKSAREASQEAHDYDQPSDWGSKVSSSPQGVGKIGNYDVPRPASAQSANSFDSPSRSRISSGGSTGSRGHGSPIGPRKGSRGQSDRLNALRTDGVDKFVERDRSPSGGSQGYPKSRSPSNDPALVSGTLRQAKEILRLAHMVKAEADEMKDEARRELELAKRERHDAELLKKNAAQILKMAKERLSDSKPRSK